MFLSNNSRLLQLFVRPFKAYSFVKCCAQFSTAAVFNPKKVLILTKLSRYEYEKRMHQQLTEVQLQQSLIARGSDYLMLLHRHNLHKSVERSVMHAFEDAGIDTRVVNRFEYTDDLINWADAVITTGGDGTYLLAASRIQSNDKPVIGFNSDPSRSKGQLCLPEKYSYNAREAVQKLLKGMFRWQFRSRIRITMIGKNVYSPPVELHDQQLEAPENRYLDIDQQLKKDKILQPYVASEPSELDLGVRVLPVLALNEVFIGECVSARVSYLELKLDDKTAVKQKCSGLIVSTGTGSTSWTYNVNKLTQQSLEQVLNIAQEQTGKDLGASNPRLINKITDKFNELLLTDPEDNRLVYTIRDQLVPPPAASTARSPPPATHALHNTLPLRTGLPRVPSCPPDTYPSTPPPSEAPSIPGSDTLGSFMNPEAPVAPRGFAQKIYCRSRCFDAFLVIDGGMSFPFNDGTRALLEMHHEDALRNVLLYEAEPIVSFKH